MDRAWASLGSRRVDHQRRGARQRHPEREHPVDLPRTSQESISRDLATAVGAETARYIDDLDDLYELTVLDPPTDASPSSSTDLAPGELMAAGLVGLALGAATHRFARRQLLAEEGVDAAPELDTDIENERYTHQRIQEERSRDRQQRLPFHVLVLQPNDPGHRLHAPAVARPSRPCSARRIAWATSTRPNPGPSSSSRRAVSDEEAAQLASRLRDAATDRLCRHYGKDAAVEVQSCKYQDRFNGGGRAAELVAAL